MMTNLDGPIYFGAIDYVLLSLMLACSMAIGLYLSFAGRGQRNKEEYLLGGRQMSAFPVSLSLFATFQSSIALLGFPTEVYLHGTMYAYVIIGLSISPLLAMVTVVPLFYPLRLISVNEYLVLRYESRFIQNFGAMIGVISCISYMTMALLSPALALETAVGIPLWLSIVVVGAVGTIYTTIGGIKTVVWTDVFQTFVMFLGAFLILIKGCIDAGGVSKVWNVGKEMNRIVFDDFNFDPRVRHTIWSLCVGYTIYWYSVFYTQSSLQRTVSTKSIQDANKVYLFSTLLNAIFTCVLVATGLVLTAYFHAIRCDPLEAGHVKNSNQLVPYFVMLTLRFLPGLSGLYISTVFSGALSTFSSGINSLAANTVEDFLYRFLRGKSEAIVTATTKLLVCLYGLACIGLAYLAKEFQGPVTEMVYTAVGASVGPLLGLFLLSATFPQANYIGALAGCCTSLVVTFWHAIGTMKFGHPTETLRGGPTDQCFSENATFTLSTNRQYFNASATIVNETANVASLGIPTYVTSSTASFNQTVNLQERKFSIYDLSYIWNPTIGVLITIIAGLIISVISNKLMSKKLRPEAKLLFPFCRRFWYSDMDVLDTDVELRCRDDGRE